MGCFASSMEETQETEDVQNTSGPTGTAKDSAGAGGNKMDEPADDDTGGGGSSGGGGASKTNSDDAKSSVPDIQARYHFKRTLGKGASCRVVEAVSRDAEKRKLAIKIMSKDRKMFKKLYEAEADILTTLTSNSTNQHKNVITFLGNEEDDLNYYILTAMCAGGELFDRIVSKEEKYIITEKKAAGLVRNMLEAIDFCHKNKIAHRDLKPENFVFESADPDADLVLIDFGCASKLSDNPSKTYSNLVGTAYYLAPELAFVALSRSNNAAIAAKYAPMVQDRTTDVLKAADIWSIGVIAYVMLTGRAPFRGRTNQAIFESIVSNKVVYPEKDVRYKTPLRLSAAFKDFVDRVLVKDPMKRLSMSDCLRHPWVKGLEAGDWKLNHDVIRYLRQYNYQSKLKKAITRVLANNMTDEPEQQVKRHFVRLDADGDGYLDADELTYLLVDMGYAHVAAKGEAVRMLKEADTNNDGLIDFDEFKAIWYRKILTTNEQYIHRVFNVFDANGDGHIDVLELKQVLMPEEEDDEPGGDDAKDGDADEDDDDDGETIQKLYSMIKEVDTNNDNQISFDEFKVAMSEDIDKGKINFENMDVGGQLNEADYAGDN